MRLRRLRQLKKERRASQRGGQGNEREGSRIRSLVKLRRKERGRRKRS
jgi:hypothetical protein